MCTTSAQLYIHLPTYICMHTNANIKSHQDIDGKINPAYLLSDSYCSASLLEEIFFEIQTLGTNRAPNRATIVLLKFNQGNF